MAPNSISGRLINCRRSNKKTINLMRASQVTIGKESVHPKTIFKVQRHSNPSLNNKPPTMRKITLVLLAVRWKFP